MNVELQTLSSSSTFPATSSHSTGFFFWLFQAGRSKCKGTWPLPCRITLLTPSHLCLCACRGHLVWPLPAAWATSPCPHHLTSCCIAVHPATAWATSPSPRHRTCHVAAHLTVARATSLCLSQLPMPSTLPCLSQLPTLPTLL